ncbi:uncharacterized protein LOC141525697 [Cotesia typhae]|uniref:uncharacterized protein LOC141525697 n=1 Tax=Cotesia typhae TaxID=2053667 RepID=UPI003D693CA7
MGRRKIIRTPEEEEEYKRLQRSKKAKYMRDRRQKQNLSQSSNDDFSSTLQNLFDMPSCSNVEIDNIHLSNRNSDMTVNDMNFIDSLRSSSDNFSRTVNDCCTINDSANNSVIYDHVHSYQQRDNVSSDLSNTEIGTSEHYIGKFDVLCKHCNAKHFATEKISNKGTSFSDCCSHGKVVLDPLPQLPKELRSFFDYSHPQSKHFHDRVRAYNSSFSFASFNANLVNFQSRPYCFKIQGQIYYQINTSLYPEENDIPRFGQLFIVDSNEANENRLANYSNLDGNILQIIDNIMRTCNKFANSYQMMHEEIKKQEIAALQNNQTIPEMQLLFSLKPGMDRRRFNLQQVNEVAAIFSTDANGEIPESYVSIRNRRTKQLQQVSTMDPNVEPWIYPLFYPFGSPGWHSKIMQTNNSNKRVSRSAYIKYRMGVRSDFNVFLNGGRLFQQWLVDSYVKIEKDRIIYCKEHQNQLRVDTYQGLHDHLQNKANDSHSQIGKVIILPSPFSGSPRNMLQNYQDAMAIVRKHGKTDLFITMTCNPNWKEIKENLLEDTLAHVYVIEFQKRGLPHVYLLVTLKSNYKMTTPEVVHKFISAEIPDPTEDPVLHEVVMKNMIYGPCEETTVGEDDDPTYRRRDTGKSYDRPNGFVVDNRNVVPYCPTLLKIFNCHINVEVVSSVASVKYLFKYVYKGHDCAAVTVGEVPSEELVINHNEIENYIEARYVSPVEATSRILGKNLQDKSHSIVRLPVHLPNQQQITLDINMTEEEMNNVLLLDKTTMLMAYFELNLRDEEARQNIYSDIPTYYT